jgi:hypothetical protein
LVFWTEKGNAKVSFLFRPSDLVWLPLGLANDKDVKKQWPRFSLFGNL